MASGLIYIISGMPRTGTSMMMQMLEKGGLDVITDNKRQADYHNIKGYYEVDNIVGRLGKGDNDGFDISTAKGKAIKILAPGLRLLPRDQNYKIIYMTRAPREVFQSMRKMITRGAPSERITWTSWIWAFRRTNRGALMFMSKVGHIEHRAFEYSKCIEHPRSICSLIDQFMPECNLDLGKMEEVPDSKLWRNKV